MEALLKLAFPKELANIFSHTLKQVEVVEELIAKKKREHPDKEEELDATFFALSPPKLLRSKHPKLYEHHVNELLERAMNGKPLQHGTKAEALCALLDTSLRVPLKQDYAALIDELFVDVFGELPEGKEPGAESWPGAKAEILEEMSRSKLKDQNRRLP